MWEAGYCSTHILLTARQKQRVIWGSRQGLFRSRFPMCKKLMFSILFPKYLLTIVFFTKESGSGRDTVSRRAGEGGLFLFPAQCSGTCTKPHVSVIRCLLGRLSSHRNLLIHLSYECRIHSGTHIPWNIDIRDSLNCRILCSTLRSWVHCVRS